MRLLALIACALVLLLAAAAPAADDPPSWQARSAEIELLQAKNLRLQRANAKLGRRVRALHRALRFDYEVTNAVKLASVVYRVPRATLWSKMWCESKGWPYARNPTAVGSEHASGLFQFLPSTYRSTPFRRVSIWDPYANALAAGWMHRAGRGGEWVCR